MRSPASCIYRGWVRHRRHAPREHVFRYPMFMLYLDLAELPAVFDPYWLWSARRPNLAWFRREDYLGPADLPLDEAVRRLVEERTGRRPGGPIRLLTHLRYGGYIFNPVSFYYCFDEAGEHVETLVAEITNTPWGERHAYVLPRPEDGAAPGEAMHWRFDKSFHVSPFWDMNHLYDWTFSEPGEVLRVEMVNLRDGERVFDASLSMRRWPLDGRHLAGMLISFPLMTLQVVAKIYWQALRLWLKRIPFHSHPKHRGGPNDSPSGIKETTTCHTR